MSAVGWQTLLEYVQEVYLPAQLGMAPGTRELRLMVCRQFQHHAGNNLGLDDLTAENVTAWLAAGLAAGWSPATVNSKRASLLAVWRFAVRTGATENPVPPCGIPRARPLVRLPEAWTIAEVRRLVATSSALPGMVGEIPARLWWASLVLAVYWTGARIGSVMMARTADCSLAERYLILRKQKSRIEQLYWLPDEAVAAIAAHYCPQRELVWPWPHRKDRPWPHGKRHFYRRFARIVKASAIPYAGGHCNLFHKLRRTNVSYTAAVLGMDAARRQAGHADSRVTLASYIDPRIARQPSAVDCLPHVF